MLPFQPESDLVDARPSLCRAVGSVLGELSSGTLPGQAELQIVEKAALATNLKARGILPYRRPADPVSVVRSWLAGHDRITSGDHAMLTGLTQPGALNQLKRLEAQGYLTIGTGRGRSAHFRPAGRLKGSRP